MSDVSIDPSTTDPAEKGSLSNGFLNNAFHVAVGLFAGGLTGIFLPVAAPVATASAAIASKEYFDGKDANPGVAVKDFIAGIFSSPKGP